MHEEVCSFSQQAMDSPKRVQITYDGCSNLCFYGVLTIAIVIKYLKNNYLIHVMLEGLGISTDMLFVIILFELVQLPT